MLENTHKTKNEEEMREKLFDEIKKNEKLEKVLKHTKQDDTHKISKNETNENNDLHEHRVQ